MKCPFLLLCWLAGAAAPSPAGLTLNPVADAFVSAANSTSNYGLAGALSASGASLANGAFDSVLKFNLASAQGATISSITLQLTASPPNNPIFNASAAGSFSIRWMANDSWAEGTGTPMSDPNPQDGITFGSLPPFLGASDEALGTFSFNGATSGTNIWSLALTPSFLADVTVGNLVSLLIVPADSTMSYTFNSVNNLNSARWPVLTVTTVPEPTAGGLLATPGCMLLMRRWRHARTA